MSHDELWLRATKETVAGYRRMIDAAIAQLSDEQFSRRPHPDFNSVAVILRHLGGNLQSRWTNFLTEDGEKPNRDRDAEFTDWTGSRENLMAHFDAGWKRLCDTLAELTADDMLRTVTIRGEAQAVPLAIQRAITHISYHAGQIVLIARMVHGDTANWQWLTIRPQGSRDFNAATWGTPSSRGTAGQKQKSHATKQSFEDLRSQAELGNED
ncbi:MAG: DinB family protein [Planctomycetaceae bacterium]